jgi:hypothetical protein
MYIRFITYTIIALLGFFVVSNAEARQSTDLAKSGSFYSSFGFGAPADIYSPNSRGMGLTGVSTFTNMSGSISNPAHWGLIGFTYGSVSLGISNYNAKDNVSSARNSLLAIDNFQVVVPIMRNQLGVSVAFTPATRSDFQVFNEGSFLPIDGLDLDPIEYQTNILGSGGVNRFEVGAGLRLASFMSVGYGLSANLLTQRQQVTSFFSDLSYRPTITNRDIDGYGFSHRFGVFFNQGNLLRSNDQISLGATVTLPLTIEAERSVTSFRTVSGGRQLIEYNEGAPDRIGNVRLPLEFNAGLTYNLNRFVNVSTEFQFQDWGNTEYSYSPTQEAYFKDRVRAGLGLQYHPYRAEQATGFFSNIRYSVGSTFDTGHLSIQGEDIETLFFNAGLGIISRSASTVDLNFHYGIRGTQSSNLVKENIWGFSLSLNLAEFMFVRQRFQ